MEKFKNMRLKIKLLFVTKNVDILDFSGGGVKYKQ